MRIWMVCTPSEEEEEAPAVAAERRASEPRWEAESSATARGVGTRGRRRAASRALPRPTPRVREGVTGENAPAGTAAIPAAANSHAAAAPRTGLSRPNVVITTLLYSTLSLSLSLSPLSGRSGPRLPILSLR
mmetsp:Transcript_29661/g.87977  ORF Transcript_29661/g.87977 Transcript_29661/m.87977 type:complete len:132 (+) Transcript_29661:1682-2077(+)